MVATGYRRLRDEGGRNSLLLLAWGLCYYLPFLFAISPETTLTTGYLSAGLYPLILFAGSSFGALLDHPRRSSRLGARMAATVLVLMCMLGCLSASAGVFGSGRLGAVGFQGSYEESTGHKAAGWWLRQHTPADTRIYACAGMVKVMRFYSARQCHGFADTKYTPVDGTYFSEVAAGINYALAAPGTAAFLRDNGFVERVRFEQAGHPVLILYGRPDPMAEPATIEVVDVNDAEAQFDRQYCHVADFVGIPRYQTWSGLRP